MEEFVKGDIVVVPFPFSDLSQSKKRPALVLANIEMGNDLILCQITSQNLYDQYSIKIEDKDFVKGSLKQTSNIRPNKIFTADKDIVLYKIGCLAEWKIKEVNDNPILIFQS